MEMIKVVYPSLDEYANRANSIAQRNGCASFLMLNESQIADEADRHEFSFIMKAVGDQLLHHEWEVFANSKPDESCTHSRTLEPEMISGSTFWVGVSIDTECVCRAN